MLEMKADIDNKKEDVCKMSFLFIPSWSIYFSHCEWVRGPSSIILSAVIHLCKKIVKINQSFLEAAIHIVYWCFPKTYVSFIFTFTKHLLIFTHLSTGWNLKYFDWLIYCCYTSVYLDNWKWSYSKNSGSDWQINFLVT